jgi:IS5 family transposase
MMLEEWGRLEPLIEKAIGQARQRVLKGNVICNEDKLLSLWEEHTQVIVRGKVGKSAEFGHKVTIWENQAGRLICGGIYPKGNPQ